MKIVLGDFSTKVSRVDTFKPVTGSESSHKISTDNCVGVANPETSLSKIRCSHILTLINLTEHLLMKDNQTEHIFMDRGRQSSVTDVRSFRRADCDTDRCPVVENNFRTD
jgi:hypothetical protein